MIFFLLTFRIDRHVGNFNSRVEDFILHLKSNEFKNQVNYLADEVVSTFNNVPIPKISFYTIDKENI